MKTVGAFEAKTHLSALLEEVEAGQPVLITKNGRPVAVLQPAAVPAQRNLDDVVTELRSFAKGRKLGRTSIRTLLEEGRD